MTALHKRLAMSVLATGLAALLPAIAHGGSAPVQSGAMTFKADCAFCHASEAAAPAGIGPNLFGVAGRKAGMLPGVSYSEAMKKSGITWTSAELKAFIADPVKRVPGNGMPPVPIKEEAKIADLVAYLETLH